jgi:hypothetical protein
MSDRNFGDTWKDEKGRTHKKIQAFIEIGKNPRTGRMMVSPTEASIILEESEEKNERKGPNT